LIIRKNIPFFFRSPNPKCPEDGEELSKKNVSAFHMNIYGKLCDNINMKKAYTLTFGANVIAMVIIFMRCK
jgi:hypothetical protein